IVDQHQLQHDRVARGSQAVTNAQLDAVAASAVVDYGKQGVRLFGAGIETLDRPEVGVALQCHRERVADVVRDAGGRGEVQLAKAIELRVQDGIEDQVEASQMRAEDRSDL